MLLQWKLCVALPAAQDGIKATNPITSTSEDTTAKWRSLGPGTYWFSQTGLLIDQPNQYGFLINYVQGGDVFQIWSSQNSGPVRFREGNASGWGVSWHNNATWADSANYANSAGSVGSASTVSGVCGGSYNNMYGNVGGGWVSGNYYYFPSGGTWRYVRHGIQAGVIVGDIAGGSALEISNYDGDVFIVFGVRVG